MNCMSNSNYNKDINLEKIFNNFIEQQIKTIDEFININNFDNTGKLPQKIFENEHNDENGIENINSKTKDIKKNYLIKNRENRYQENLILEKEKERDLELLKSENQKLKNKLEDFTIEDNYDNNNKIEELFNKIANKKTIKYNSIKINDNIDNIIKNDEIVSNNKINKSISVSNNLENDSNDSSNNNIPEKNNLEKLIYNSKNELSRCNTSTQNINSNREFQTFLKKPQKTQINTESPIKNHIFAFKNNSFNNNNSELNKSSKNEDKPNKENSEKDKDEEDSSSSSNENNSDEKEIEENEGNEKNDEIEEKDKTEEKNDNKTVLNKKKKKKPTFILSQSNNIMDLFSKNEKNRLKKFSVNNKNENISDLFFKERLKTKEEKPRKKNSKIFTFPINQNFKSIKNINNGVKTNTGKNIKAINNQKLFAFYRTRSKSYKVKRVNNKISKKLDGMNTNNNNKNEETNNNKILKDFFNKNNYKNFSYSYNDENIVKNSKLNKRKNKRYFTGHFNVKNKHKLSMPGYSKEKISKMLGLESTNNLIRKNKTKVFEKNSNAIKRRSNSLGKKNKSYTFEEKELIFLNKKSGNSFFSGMNNKTINSPNVSNNNIIFKNDINGEDDKLYKMIKNFENNVKERLMIDENKIKQNNNKNKINSMYLHNNLNNNMNINMNFNNNILFKNNINNFGEVELIPKKYIFRCQKVIYPEIESEKIKERERLLFGKNNKFY